MFSGRHEACVIAAAVCVPLFAGCFARIDPEAQLLDQLKGKVAAERATAAVIISEMRPVPEKFVPQLLEALQDEDPQVRLSIAMAFCELGSAGRPHLTEIGRLSNEHADPQVRFELQRAFNRIKDSQ